MERKDKFEPYSISGRKGIPTRRAPQSRPSRSSGDLSLPVFLNQISKNPDFFSQHFEFPENIFQNSNIFSKYQIIKHWPVRRCGRYWTSHRVGADEEVGLYKTLEFLIQNRYSQMFTSSLPSQLANAPTNNLDDDCGQSYRLLTMNQRYST